MQNCKVEFVSAMSARINWQTYTWLQEVYKLKGDTWWYYGNLPEHLRSLSALYSAAQSRSIIGKMLPDENVKMWKINTTKMLKK